MFLELVLPVLSICYRLKVLLITSTLYDHLFNFSIDFYLFCFANFVTDMTNDPNISLIIFFIYALI